MSEHPQDLLLHERREPDRGPGVVGEDQERGAVGNEAARHGEPVEDRRHAVLPDAEMEVAAPVGAALDRRRVLDPGPGRGLEIGASARQRGNQDRGALEHHVAVVTGSARLAGRRRHELVEEVLRDALLHHRVPQPRLLRLIRLPALHSLVPRVVLGPEPGGALREQHPHLGRDQERGRLRPPQGALGGRHLLGAERLAVRLAGVLLLRGPVGDVAARDDEARAPGLRHGPPDRRLELGAIVRIGAPDLPPVGLEAPGDVLGEGEPGVALDRDVVVVVEVDEVPEPPVTGERGGLGGHAFHQVAVAHDAEHAVARGTERARAEARRQHPGGECHPDPVSESLPERTRGGLDSRGEPELGVARRAAAEPTEPLQLLERQVVAREMEQGVEQHRTVSRREHEAVAVGPRRVVRLVAQEARPDHEGRIGHPHRHAGVAALGLLHGVDGEEAEGVDRELLERGLRPRELGQRPHQTRAPSGAAAGGPSATAAAPQSAVRSSRMTCTGIFSSRGVRRPFPVNARTNRPSLSTGSTRGAIPPPT